MASNQKKSTGKSGASASSPLMGGPMDVQLLQRIIDLMTANDLSAVELSDGDRRIMLKRGAESVVVPMQAAPSHAAAPQPAPGAGTAHHKPTPADEEAGLLAIKSPMVGTFYSSPSPDAPTFVSLGTPVDEDTDVCIIEAMKVFNNIKAECRGTIARILIENGQSVEFGQTLFLVKPA